MINLYSYLCECLHTRPDLEPERVAVLFHVDEQTQYNQQSGDKEQSLWGLRER